MIKNKSNRYYLIALIIIVFVAILFLAFKQKSSTGATLSMRYQTYTLDTTDIIETHPYFGGPKRETPWGISHNAVIAFPIDLSKENKKIAETSPATVIQAQTEEGCWEEASVEGIVSSIEGFGPLKTKDTANVRKIQLEMSESKTFCIGFHIKNSGWVWNFTKVESADNFAEVVVNQRQVDAIGILFDRGAEINKIMYDAIKVE